MTTARDVMSSGAECIKEDQTLLDAARMMRDLDVGSLPICGKDDKLHGMITDRDIVVHCLAEGMDPATVKAGSMAQGKLYWVDADTDMDDALAVMQEHQVKRLPVMDKHRLVGMISESDLTRRLDEHRMSHFAQEVYAR
ncbi:CBS domain-containing protein [Ornithinimicrobium tianjinense]|uniref:Hypoxic response protein 1 n=1 Tax=Ornithinimicrobium tianjinense TaxID=1195761 RepID=A0A917F511_9MICO|nr:CBS domain-containing protein [Ornithinimicrobium tianjinense]GGF43974.1 hypoxic response protein 1 [Ornithinimicrobium tianjinense]